MAHDNFHGSIVLFLDVLDCVVMRDVVDFVQLDSVNLYSSFGQGKIWCRHYW